MKRGCAIALRSQGNEVGTATIWASDSTSRGQILQRLRDQLLRAELLARIRTLLDERHPTIQHHEHLAQMTSSMWSTLAADAARSSGLDLAVSQRAERGVERASKIPISSVMDLPPTATKHDSLRPTNLLDPTSLTPEGQQVFDNRAETSAILYRLQVPDEVAEELGLPEGTALVHSCAAKVQLHSPSPR